MSQLSPNLNVMIQAAEKAARSLVRDFGEVEKLQVSRKGPGDFVSRADTRAEETIHEHLEMSRPGYGFLMEESGEVKTESDYRWIVDPLDGTKNFLHGIPYWNISIALEHKGEIIAGIVYNPITDEMFRAEKGRGAFMNRQRLRVSGRDQFESSVILIGRLPKDLEGQELYKNQLDKLASVQAFGLRRHAACALDMCYVAAGRVEAYFETITTVNPWDMAAGSIIIKEAGGVVTDFNLTSNYIETQSLLSGNPAIHRKLADLFECRKKNNKKSA